MSERSSVDVPMRMLVNHMRATKGWPESRVREALAELVEVGAAVQLANGSVRVTHLGVLMSKLKDRTGDS